MSSGYSGSPNTGSGSSAAGESTSISAMKISIAPVGSSGFSVPSGRRRTVPSIRTTDSARSRSAAANAGLSGSATHWVSP